MKASELLETLLSHSSVNADKVQSVYDSLPKSATIRDFRTEIVNQELMTYTEVMTLFITKNLLPRSKGLLSRIEKDRESKVHHKPKTHQQKFHIGENEDLVADVVLASGMLPVHIPAPDFSKLKFHHSDEKQAVMLAVEMVNLGEINEAEIILLETLDSFSESDAAIQTLCWVYICTGHNDQIEHWANNSLKDKRGGLLTLELLCLAEQLQNKHLLAAAHYQKLLRLKQVKSLWYVLIAYSQEQSQCLSEAAENYNIYITIGSDAQLKQFAQQHLNELTS